MRRAIPLIVFVFACLLTPQPAAWAGNLYANNASVTDYIQVMDTATGIISDEFFTRPGNGRGVVVVGNTLYYTLASSPSVFSYNLTTHTDNGALFTVAGTSGLATMAWDGTNFWIGDYSGTNNAYKYSPTGTLLSTISFANCTGFCDGLEFFLENGQPRLISNRTDGPLQSTGTYDVYDTAGNLVDDARITTPFSATGIAFDGTNFYVSDINNAKIWVYTQAGAFVRTMDVTGTLPGFPAPLIEDLSVDYQQVLPPPDGVPEPASLLMLGSGLLALGWWRRRRA